MRPIELYLNTITAMMLMSRFILKIKEAVEWQEK